MNFLNNIFGNFGSDDRNMDIQEEENELNEEMVNEEPEEQRTPFFRPKFRSAINENPNMIKVEILKPENYEEAFLVIDSLKEKKATIINLESVDGAKALRILDTVQGGSRALNGHVKKITNYIFMVAPKNYSIENLEEKNQSRHDFYIDRR